MTEWKPEDPDRPGSGSSDDTTRIPSTPSGASSDTGSQHRYGDPDGREDTARIDAGSSDQFGGLGFRGEQEGAAYQAAPQSAPERRRRRGGALLLTGALLLGLLGGVGGAAGYASLDDSSDDGTATASAPSSSSTIDNKPAGNTTADPESTEAVAARVLPSVVKINVSNQQEEGSGSGIIISSDGEILTNNHVASVGQGGTISVSFNDGTAKKATIVGTDPVTDLAVIKAEGVSGLTPATIGTSSRVAVGENVVAIGSPYGLQATVTSGIVSALNRPVSVSSSEEQQQLPGQQSSSSQDTTYPAIQTDAAINPGNSGGPLVDLDGDVIGINSSIRTASDGGLTSSEGGSIGLGFAIPIQTVWPVVQQLRAGETPTHAKMGVSVTDAESDGGLLTGAGVQDVTAGSAAADAGLKKGDVITKVDDDVITGSESLVATIRGHRPGDKVTLTVVSGTDKSRTLEVTLDSDAKS